MIEVEGLPVGPVDFRVARKGHRPPGDPELFDVATVTITPPETSASVVLPAASGY
jgi:hypothetical protein